MVIITFPMTFSNIDSSVVTREVLQAALLDECFISIIKADQVLKEHEVQVFLVWKSDALLSRFKPNTFTD